MVIDQKDIDALLPSAIGASFGMLWTLQDIEKYPDFSTRRESFFACIETWMNGGVLLLHRRSVLLTGTINEQLKVFRNAFPCCDADVDMEVHYGALWFYFDECPAEPVWIREDGQLDYS